MKERRIYVLGATYICAKVYSNPWWCLAIRPNEKGFEGKGKGGVFKDKQSLKITPRFLVVPKAKVMASEDPK